MKEKKEINVQVGARVKLSREAAGLTQERFAELIDVSTQYVSDMERGKVGLSITTLQKICVSLAVSSDYLLLGRQGSQELPGIASQLTNLDPKYLPPLEDIIHRYMEAITLASQS